MPSSREIVGWLLIAKKYKFLSTVQFPGGVVDGCGLQAVQNHIVELLQTSVQERARELTQATKMTEETCQQKTKSIYRALEKLTPGRNSGILAIIYDTGNITTELAHISSTLNNYW